MDHFCHIFFWSFSVHEKYSVSAFITDHVSRKGKEISNIHPTVHPFVLFHLLDQLTFEIEFLYVLM